MEPTRSSVAGELRLGLRVWTSFEDAAASAWKLHSRTRGSNYWFDWFENCKPRVFGCRGSERSVLIFTDAAYEKGVASYGVILVDLFASSQLVSGGTIAPALVEMERPKPYVAGAASNVADAPCNQWYTTARLTQTTTVPWA